MDQVGNRMKCWWGEMLKSKATKGVTGSISSFLVWLPWIPYLHICCIHENLDWRRICKKDPKGWPLQKLSIRAELQKHSLNNVRISYNVSTYKKNLILDSNLTSPMYQKKECMSDVYLVLIYEVLRKIILRKRK